MPEIDVQDIDHLDIIAGIVDDIGIVEIIDRELGIHPQEKVSAGQVLKAMILNCMGFLTAPLYLFSDFFLGKATEHLIDGTSMSVHGKYQTTESGERNLVEEEATEPVAIAITQGYSRDHRPDLKQFTWHLLTSEEEGIPIFMNVADGNKTDQSAFPEVIKAFQAEWEGEQPDLYVMDAAFYSETNLREFGNSIDWISRVPATIKAAQELIQTILPEQFSEQKDHKGYRFCVVCSTYAGVKQQWIVVESQQRMESDFKTLSKQIEKALKEKEKVLKSLMNKSFACEADALSAITDFEKTLNYHRLDEPKILAQPHYSQRGRPHTKATHHSFHVLATLVENPLIVAIHRQQVDHFILATNSLDSQKWTECKILREYKGQQSTERGFRFLKDPLFFASSVFLKNTKRIMALAMIMTLALMVYSLGQRQLRLSLEKANATLPDQKGKPSPRPTLRWILQCFLSVHLVFLDHVKYQIKLTDRQNLILQFLGTSSRKYYFLS